MDTFVITDFSHPHIYSRDHLLKCVDIHRQDAERTVEHGSEAEAPPCNTETKTDCSRKGRKGAIGRSSSNQPPIPNITVTL